MPASRYWICDSGGRILGPLAIETLRQLLASGRVKDVVRVRKDSESWQRLEQVPEVAAALETAGELPQLEVARIRSWLGEFRGRPVHEVFGVACQASVEQYRVAYFRMVKAYHPARLPAGSPEELRSACVEMFQFLAKLMAAVEKGTDGATPANGSKSCGGSEIATPANGSKSGGGTNGTTPPNGSKSGGASNGATPPNGSKSGVINGSPGTATERSQAQKRFSYGPDEFVGITPGKNFLQATVRVTPQNVQMFTKHALVNLSTQGVFLPTSRPVPLGTLLDVRFEFEDSPHQITTRGRVVWENVGVTSMGAGLGVRFIRLAKDDQEFIQRFVDKVTQPAPNARQAG